MNILVRTMCSAVIGLFLLELAAGAGVLPQRSRQFLPATMLVNAWVGEELHASAVHREVMAGEPSATPSQARIVIRALGIVSPIVFPTATDLDTLARALDQGAVHYPASAFPHEFMGNVFLFGHSSSRPIERNPARTVFTRLAELEPGQEIEIRYRDRAYAYRVHSVKTLKPWEAEIYFATEKRMLTLSTCWPIGDPTNRFIVEAEFVKSYPLESVGSEVGTSS